MVTSLTEFAIGYNYTYTYTPNTTTNTALAAGIGMFTLVVALICIALAIVGVVAIWRVFAKAGRPGWAALVPFYNSWVLAEIAGKPGWWGLLPLVAFVPVIGWITAIAVMVIISLGLAHNFGKSDAFGIVGLFLFSIIGYLILGFGSATYKPSGTSAAAPSAPVMPSQPVPPAA